MAQEKNLKYTPEMHSMAYEKLCIAIYTNKENIHTSAIKIYNSKLTAGSAPLLYLDMQHSSTAYYVQGYAIAPDLATLETAINLTAADLLNEDLRDTGKAASALAEFLGEKYLSIINILARHAPGLGQSGGRTVDAAT